MLKNKIVRLAALFLGSLAIINVGMFFFLKMTEPKMGARADKVKTKVATTSDSLAHASPVAKADTTAAAPQSATTPSIEQTSAEPARTQQPVAASLATPAAPALPTPPEPQPTISSVDSTPVAVTPDSAASHVSAAAVANGDTKEMAKLAKLLESVKPEEAASIASQLDIEQIVALVMKMKDRSAGKMLAAMPPEQAALVALRMSQMATQARGKS
jgi:hypothetical protein